MPELPEVEVVRGGLADHVVGRRVDSVTVLDTRSLRRHAAGPEDFALRLTGRTVTAAQRRGKYLWLPLDDGDAMIAHLGMSGQMLVSQSDAKAQKHLKVVLHLDDGVQLRFVDQRIFGGLLLSEALLPDGHGDHVPTEIAHIARDPLDPHFDLDEFAARLKRRDTQIKRALLDQSLISGVGNIYADEALWRVPLHYERSTRTLRRPSVESLVGHVTDVMAEALAQGGTSFDALYVNVNGASGYFDRSLNAYGREGEACARCGTALRRSPFMNRSSFWCPACQPRPRARRH